MTRRSALFHPLVLAGLLALVAVALSFRFLPPAQAAPAWWLLAGFSVLFLAQEAGIGRRHGAVLAALVVLALALLYVSPRIGTAQILLVVWAALVVDAWPAWRATIAILVVDLVAYLVVRDGGHPAPLVSTLVYVAFQGFAALVTHYAKRADAARDRLALLNADLLATRALLADSARDAERLRVARELHDVAGHKLTALTLNLRVLAGDPAIGTRPEIAVAQQLSRELLADLRAVVQALRDSRGLDMRTALLALAAPLPDLRLRLDIADDVLITDAAQAETVLRIVQEALTNSARHAGARTLAVAIAREGDALRIAIEDDGRVRDDLREGNGLAGMRERVAAAGGTLELATAPHGALRIAASLPVAVAP